MRISCILQFLFLNNVISTTWITLRQDNRIIVNGVFSGIQKQVKVLLYCALKVLLYCALKVLLYSALKVLLYCAWRSLREILETRVDASLWLLCRCYLNELWTWQRRNLIAVEQMFFHQAKPVWYSIFWTYTNTAWSILSVVTLIDFPGAFCFCCTTYKLPCLKTKNN